MSQTLEQGTGKIVQESFSDKIAFPATVAMISAVGFGYLSLGVHNNSSVVKDYCSIEAFVPLGIAFGFAVGSGVGYFIKRKIERYADRVNKKKENQRTN